MKKTYKAFMQFSLAELKAELSIKEAGVTIGMPTTDTDKFNNLAAEKFNINLNDIPPPNTEGMRIPEGLEPKAEDFLYVPFRLLSATMVAAGSWRSTMFPAKVLRKATDMLLGKGVFTDHDDRPKNWTGYVAKTQWQAATKQNGETIPGGINGLLAIDTTEERNRDVAKGIINGAVYSNSVGIQFMFKMSHDYDDEWEFRRRVGTIHEDGTMVHLIVTDIIDIHETSLVNLGADPYAKRIGTDGLINVDNGGTYTEDAANTLNLSFNKENETNKFNIVCGLNKNVLFLTGKEYSNNAMEKPKVKKMNEKLIKALLAKFGVKSIEDLTEQVVNDFTTTDDATIKVKALALSKVQEKDEAIADVDLAKFAESHVFVSTDELAELKQSVSKVEELTATVAELEATKVTLTANAAIGESFLQSQRDLAKKLYRLEKMDAADETIVALFDKASQEELSALIKQHGIVIGDKFSYSCGDCGSHDFKFQSSKENLENEPTTEDSGLKIVNANTIREQRLRNKMK